jgi:hypothetical protein
MPGAGCLRKQHSPPEKLDCIPPGSVLPSCGAICETETFKMLLAALWIVALAPAAIAADRFALPSEETLHYEIEWRLITAGRATLQWSASPGQKPGWQIKMHLESAGLVSKLYKVDNQYTSVLASNLCAVTSHLVAHEGRRHRETRVTYDREEKRAQYVEKDLSKDTVLDTKQIEIPSCVHDVLGGLYVLRTLDLQPGQSTEIPVSDGKKSVFGKVEAEARETVKTKAGSFETIRYQAHLFNNVLFRRSAKLYVWITDDERRLPVQIRVQMRFTIGTITLQLQKEQHS